MPEDNQRFGEPKAFAEIDSQPFYRRIIDVLEATNMFNQIIISTNDQLQDKFDYPHILVDEAQHKIKGLWQVFMQL